MTDSPQRRSYWPGEQALNWSGLPVVHVRATVFSQHFFFSQWAAESIAKDDTIRLPFGEAMASRIDARDAAVAIAAVLEKPEGHAGRVIELTGPKSRDMRAVAAEYSRASGRDITYIDIPVKEWREKELPARGSPDPVAGHMKTMAQLHTDNRHDRPTHDFEAMIGRPATSVRDHADNHPKLFGARTAQG